MTEEDRCIVRNEAGDEHEIVKWQHWTTFSPNNGPKRQLPGGHEWRTIYGEDVNEMRDGTFRLLNYDDDIVFRRVEE